MMNEDIQEVLLSRQLKIQLNNFDSVFFWSYEKHHPNQSEPRSE